MSTELDHLDGLASSAVKIVTSSNHSFKDTSNNTIVGWIGPSKDRSTLDIIYSSVITIVLCVWISTYPNVPAPRDRLHHWVIDKFNLAMIGFLGPDLLFALALGQWSSARRSVKEFRRIVSDDSDSRWSITHGFYADMGGFRIMSNCEEQGVPTEHGIPVNAKQWLYLIEHGFIDIPSLKERDIKATSSSDSLSKILVLWQVIWFITTEVTRLASRTPITTLELTALIFAVMMLATSFAWFQKPQVTVSTRIRLRDGVSFQDIRNTAMTSTHPDMQDKWHDTPLDFIWKRSSFHLDKQWQYFSYLSHACHVPLFTRLPSRHNTAWERMPSDIWYRPRGFLVLLGLVVQIPFCFSFLGAWNFHFASRAELLLWRMCAVYHAAYSLVITLYYILGLGDLIHQEKEKMSQSRIEKQPHLLSPTGIQPSITGTGRIAALLPLFAGQVTVLRTHSGNNPSASRKVSFKRKLLSTLHRWKNLSPGRDIDHEISLRWTALLFFLTVIYIFSHLYIYLEDIISLRSQPENVFLANNQFYPFIK